MKNSIVLSALVMMTAAAAYAADATVDPTDPNLKPTPQNAMEATADVRNVAAIDGAPSGDASNGEGIRSTGCCGSDTNSYGTNGSSAGNQPIKPSGVGTNPVAPVAGTKTSN